MNTVRSRFAAALVGCIAALSVLPCAVGVGAPTGPGDSELVPFDHYTRFIAARGLSPQQVQRQLGTPHHRIYPNVWVYWNCEPEMPEDKDRKCDTMIITFTNGGISSVRLAPRAVVEALIAQVKAAQEAGRNRVAVRE